MINTTSRAGICIIGFFVFCWKIKVCNTHKQRSRCRSFYDEAVNFATLPGLPGVGSFSMELRRHHHLLAPSLLLTSTLPGVSRSQHRCRLFRGSGAEWGGGDAGKGLQSGDFSGRNCLYFQVSVVYRGRDGFMAFLLTGLIACVKYIYKKKGRQQVQEHFAQGTFFLP